MRASIASLLRGLASRIEPAAVIVSPRVGRLVRNPLIRGVPSDTPEAWLPLIDSLAESTERIKQAADAFEAAVKRLDPPDCGIEVGG